MFPQNLNEMKDVTLLLDVFIHISGPFVFGKYRTENRESQLNIPQSLSLIFAPQQSENT